ncbi:zinc finger BED domain-containing protein 5-like [Haematobia irritans]|uniref:zinc finger BED domain-containing protein 5-like n=1 Tax=Haematobia irritans TaxID=7368 RepID=UPI003F4FB220
MRPIRLKRHLSSLHPEYENKPPAFFEARLSTLRNMKINSTSVFNLEAEKALEASFEISWIIARNKKPHTIGELVIKPSIIAAASKMLDNNAVRQLSKIPLSNNTVKRRIDEMASDVKSQLIQHIKDSPLIALQCDETTDVSCSCQLLFYCRYIKEDSICEELLFSKPLTTTSKGEDIFKALSDFLDANDIPWGKIAGICTDGAPSMTGCKSGFIHYAKQKNNNIIFTHCVIHRQALAARTLPDELRSSLNCAIEVVNFIKCSALRTRLFETLCLDLNADHKNLLFHTQVRWLSKGNMLGRLYELKNEVEIFLLSTKNEKLYDCFTNKNTIIFLAYLADFFEILNNLNLKLQGETTNILTALDSINSFMEKIKLWKKRILSPFPKYTSFPRLNDILDSEDIENRNLDGILLHLDALLGEFNRYFPDMTTDCWQNKLFRNPFLLDVMVLPEDIQEEAIDLKNDSIAKDDFDILTTENFWLKYRNFDCCCCCYCYCCCGWLPGYMPIQMIIQIVCKTETEIHTKSTRRARAASQVEL